MGNAKRFKDIINSNINFTLEKAENPEKMIRLMVQEMEETLIDLKASCAAKIAEKTRLEREQKAVQESLIRWKSRAELAVDKGRDDLAREALVEKRKAERDLDAIAQDLVQFETIITECRANTLKLEDKLQTIREKQRILIQRGIHAQEQKRAQETMRHADGTEAFRKFTHLEEKIERMEAEAKMAGFHAPSSKENEFFMMEHESEVEAELAALKQSKTKKA